MWTNDPLADFHRYDAQQEIALSRCPKCQCCKKPIQEDYCYETDMGDYCEECFEEKVLDALRDKRKKWIDY